MSDETKAIKKGGARAGAGRPKLWGTKTMLVPIALVKGFETIIEEYKTVYKEMKSK